MLKKSENPSVLELLAPAGSEECLLAALDFGADSVYLGGTRFGMRSAPKNFDAVQLARAVEMAHERDVKVYVTCNAIAHNRDIDLLPAFLTQTAQAGADALIVADLGVLSLAKKYAPDTDIHISTQCGVTNYETANMLHSMGASRIVLARELSLEDIYEIRLKTPKELSLEAFAHGAMCVSFSGRCLLSNYLTQRDSNRGDCAQPCRWKYSVMEETRPGEYLPIDEDEDGTYIFNAKDMCMIEHLPAMAAAGIDCVKIEGRAKSAYYTAVVTNAYRSALNGYAHTPSADYTPAPWIVEELKKISYREYCTGFYFGTPATEASVYFDGGYRREWEISGVVDASDGRETVLTQRNRFFVGDRLEVLEPGTQPYTVTVNSMKNENGENIEVAPHPMMKVVMECDRAIKPGSLLRKEKA